MLIDAKLVIPMIFMVMMTMTTMTMMMIFVFKDSDGDGEDDDDDDDDNFESQTFVSVIASAAVYCTEEVVTRQFLSYIAPLS